MTRKRKPEPDYRTLRPRRCAFCNEWFREPGKTLPQHLAKGLPCAGSNKTELPPLAVPRNSDWREDAACLDADPRDIFWTTKDSPDMFDALSYCRGCPVLAQCYKNADDDKYFTGVAGGAVWTPRERRLRREAGRALAEENANAAYDPDASQEPEHRSGTAVEE